MDQNKHLARRNQENNIMRDNIAEDFQRQLQLAQHQVSHVA
jgi:hypothetical protein